MHTTTDRPLIMGLRTVTDDEGETSTIDIPVCVVSVYVVRQTYGGPEEGGWWYDDYTRVLSIPLLSPGDAAEVDAVTSFLAPRWEDSDRKWYLIVAEADRGYFETSGRPTYQ